ncbi:MAG: type II toxin-antitoxin system death-on-curing family toxin [Chloroflexi bacterium]|nr:type II toxin-antitoxin system death-on-curing family toxin [Chloroflexota bacterium]
MGLLESALAEPQQTFGGRFLHRTIFDKAAALFRSLIKNHPLIDGNKRLALSAVTAFLLRNGYVFYVPYNEAVNMALQVASEGRQPDLQSLER